MFRELPELFICQHDAEFLACLRIEFVVGVHVVEDELKDEEHAGHEAVVLGFAFFEGNRLWVAQRVKGLVEEVLLTRRKNVLGGNN